MIVFDLACSNGHVAEAWFGSREDYEGQRARGLVSCPVCGDAAVERALSVPRIAGTGERVAPDPKTMLRALATMQQEMLKGSEHVGDRFAAEARAMHDGETAERPIHGRATVAEAKALADDGVPVMPLPLPVREPAREN